MHPIAWEQCRSLHMSPGNRYLRTEVFSYFILLQFGYFFKVQYAKSSDERQLINIYITSTQVTQHSKSHIVTKQLTTFTKYNQNYHHKIKLLQVEKTMCLINKLKILGSHHKKNIIVLVYPILGDYLFQTSPCNF